MGTSLVAATAIIISVAVCCYSARKRAREEQDHACTHLTHATDNIKLVNKNIHRYVKDPDDRDALLDQINQLDSDINSAKGNIEKARQLLRVGHDGTGDDSELVQVMKELEKDLGGVDAAFSGFKAPEGCTKV